MDNDTVLNEESLDKILSSIDNVSNGLSETNQTIMRLVGPEAIAHERLKQAVLMDTQLRVEIKGAASAYETLLEVGGDPSDMAAHRIEQARLKAQRTELSFIVEEATQDLAKTQPANQIEGVDR